MNHAHCTSLVVVLAFVCLSSSQSLANDVDEKFKDLDKRLKGAVVLVNAMGSHPTGKRASGFVIDGGNTVITNYHVISGSRAVFATFPGPQRPIPCQLIDARADLDLAALHLERPPDIAVPVLRLAQPDHVPERLDEVIIIGCPKHLDWSVVPGSVAKVDVRHGDLVGQSSRRGVGVDPDLNVYQITAVAASGTSGAPVINADGNVVGIFYAGIDGGRPGLQFCVPHHNVLKMRLDRTPRNFDKGPNLPRLQGNFGQYGVDYLAENSVQNTGPARAIQSIGSLHWGFVPEDADAIFRYCIEDKQRFTNVIHKRHVANLARRKRLLHVTNPFFGYNVIVPQGYHITESVANNGAFVSVIGVPPDRNVVRITAIGIGALRTREEAMNELQRQAAWFRRIVCNVNLTSPPLNSLDPNMYELGPLSEANPWYSAQTGSIRQWHRYANHPRFGWSRLILYAIKGSVFYTVDIAFPTGVTQQAMLPERFVEHMFIAHSFSFVAD